MQRTDPTGRIQEIDIAKGVACFLMIASHLVGGRLLPASTFSACSERKGSSRAAINHPAL
jgi:uncharacterized membrane protein